jgi:hypothetical protein
MKAPQELDVRRKSLLVDERRASYASSDASGERDVPARYAPAKGFSDFPLPTRELGRKADRGVEETVIDGSQFHRDAGSSHRALRGTESRHAPYH